LNSCVGRRYRRLSGPRGVAHLVYSENFVSPRAHTSRSSYGGPGGEGGAAAAAAAAARDVYAPGKIKYVEKYDGDAHARATRALSLSLSLSLFLPLLPPLAQPQPSARVDAGIRKFRWLSALSGTGGQRSAQRGSEAVQPHGGGGGAEGRRGVVRGGNFSRQVRRCILFAGFARISRRDRPKIGIERERDSAFPHA
jgi:hypothetical protein